MNFSFYVEKLYDSDAFKEFIRENPKAYPCSAFFSINVEDKNRKDNQMHFDFFIPEKKEIVSFQLENDCKLVPADNFDKESKLSEIFLGYVFDFSNVEELIQDKMEKENVKNKIQKILLSMQNLNGKDYFIGTVFISRLGLVKVKIGVDKMKILDFEKKSVMDMISIFKKKRKMRIKSH